MLDPQNSSLPNRALLHLLRQAMMLLLRSNLVEHGRPQHDAFAVPQTLALGHLLQAVVAAAQASTIGFQASNICWS